MLKFLSHFLLQLLKMSIPAISFISVLAQLQYIRGIEQIQLSAMLRATLHSGGLYTASGLHHASYPHTAISNRVAPSYSLKQMRQTHWAFSLTPPCLERHQDDDMHCRHTCALREDQTQTGLYRGKANVCQSFSMNAKHTRLCTSCRLPQMLPSAFLSASASCLCAQADHLKSLLVPRPVSPFV